MVKGKNNFLDIRFNPHHGHVGLDPKSPQRNGFCNYRDVRFMVYEAGLIFIKNYRRFKFNSLDKVLKVYLKERYTFVFLSKFPFLPFDKFSTLMDYSVFIYQLSYILSPGRVKKRPFFTPEYVYSILKEYKFESYVC